MILRTILVFVIFLYQTTVCQSQIFGKRSSYGILVGVGKAGFWTEEDTYGARDHVAYSVGFYASKFISNRFEPYVGFSYEEKGYVFDKVFDNSAEFLTTHVSMRYYPFKISGLHAILGGYAGLLVKSEEDFNEFDWGTRVGLGYKFMVYRVYGVELQAISDIGLRHDGNTRDGKHLLRGLKIGAYRYFR